MRTQTAKKSFILFIMGDDFGWFGIDADHHVSGPRAENAVLTINDVH